MRPQRARSIALTAALLAGTSAQASDFGFSIFSPSGSPFKSTRVIIGGIAGDGSAIIGEGTFPTSSKVGFRWTPSTGFTFLQPSFGPPSLPVASSHDGKFVVGTAKNATGKVGPARWNSQGLPKFFSGFPTNPEDGMLALAVANTGQTFGTAWSPGFTAVEGATFVDGGFAQKLDPLPGYTNSHQINSTSADGTIIFGRATNAAGFTDAFRRDTAGVATVLPYPTPCNSCTGFAVTGTNPSATTGVGSFLEFDAQLGFVQMPVSYVEGVGSTRLSMPSGGMGGEAFDVSASGLRIIGNVATSSVNSMPVVWEGGRVYAIADLMAANGVQLPAGFDLGFPFAISDDGTTIVGTGIDASNNLQIWIATLPEASLCYADCDQSGDLAIDDFICFQTLFAIGDPSADCDESGTLSIDDFICFQTLFAIGC